MYVCMYVCMYVYMYTCMYVCMYMCMYIESMSVLASLIHFYFNNRDGIHTRGEKERKEGVWVVYVQRTTYLGFVVIQLT